MSTLKITFKRTFSCLFLCFFLSQVNFAQHRSCDLQHQIDEQMNDPEFVNQLKQQKDEIRNIISNTSRSSAICATPLIIPVAVHYQQTNIPDQCLIDAAVAQIDQLNLDFSSCNANASLFCDWMDAGCTAPGGTAGEDAMPMDGACIQFCLADQNLPNDNSIINTGPYAITTGYSTNNQNAPAAWQGYLNLYVGPINALGFVPFFGGNNANNTRGASTLSSAWGAAGFNGCNGIGTDNTFGNGATATHEVGHWFGLDHTFQESPNVPDTPPQGQPNYGCNNTPINLSTCNQAVQFGATAGDYSGNFMDYVDDNCMFMFSDDQVNIMTNFADRQVDWATNSISCFSTISYPACSNQAGSCGALPPTGCPPNYAAANALSGNASQTGGSYNNGDYETDGDIESTQNILANQTIDYDSQTLICLNSGFSTSNNVSTVNFYAFIDGCNGGTGGGNLTDETEEGHESFFDNQEESKVEKTDNRN